MDHRKEYIAIVEDLKEVHTNTFSVMSMTLRKRTEGGMGGEDMIWLVLMRISPDKK